MATPVEFYLSRNWRVTSPYGPRTHPVTGKEQSFHHGMDFGIPLGGPLHAPVPTPYAGVVTAIGTYGGRGKVVVVRIDGISIVQLFQHLHAYSCKVGDKLKAGDVVGLCGTTGTSTAVHLHYELRYASSTAVWGDVWGDPAKFRPASDAALKESEADPIIAQGIDVSSHQGLIDWDRVKAAGIEFAMLRAGYGLIYKDTQFERNVRECNRLGIPCGAYWFSYAITADKARQEARAILEIIRPFKIEYPVCFDLEYDTLRYAKQQGVTIGKAQATAHAKAFLAEIEAAGYYAMNYSNKDYLINMFDASLLKKYDLWYALWAASKDRECGIWQYSATGHVDGISGIVDLNYSYKDYPAIIRAAGLNRLGSGIVAPPVEPGEKELPVNKNDRLMVISFDDFNASDYLLAYPALKALGVRGTSYAHTGPMTAQAWTHAREMVTDGWDIQCHTITHPHLTQLSDAQIHAELQGVNAAFSENGLPIPEHHAYPSGDYDSRVIDIVKQYRKTARTVKADTFDGINRDTLNWYELHPVGGDIKTEEEWAYLKGRLDTAYKNNRIVITIHHHTHAAGDPNPPVLSTRVDLLKRMVEYALGLGFRIVTISQIYSLLTGGGASEPVPHEPHEPLPKPEPSQPTPEPMPRPDPDLVSQPEPLPEPEAPPASGFWSALLAALGDLLRMILESLSPRGR